MSAYHLLLFLIAVLQILILGDFPGASLFLLPFAAVAVAVTTIFGLIGYEVWLWLGVDLGHFFGVVNEFGFESCLFDFFSSKLFLSRYNPIRFLFLQSCSRCIQLLKGGLLIIFVTAHLDTLFINLRFFLHLLPQLCLQFLFRPPIILLSSIFQLRVISLLKVFLRISCFSGRIIFSLELIILRWGVAVRSWV